jgi:hypothetical protein
MSLGEERLLHTWLSEDDLELLAAVLQGTIGGLKLGEVMEEN